MASNSYPVVNSNVLSQHRLKWISVEYPKKIIYVVPAGVPHAIVRDEKTLDDVGVVLYPERNGLPYSELNFTAKYMFWRDMNVTRARGPDRN